MVSSCPGSWAGGTHSSRPGTVARDELRTSQTIGARKPLLPSDNPEAKLLWTAAARAAAFRDSGHGKAGAADKSQTPSHKSQTIFNDSNSKLRVRVRVCDIGACSLFVISRPRLVGGTSLSRPVRLHLPAARDRRIWLASPE